MIYQPDTKTIDPPYNEETLELAKKAAKQKGWLQRATPEEKEAWIQRLAEDFVAAGEAEYEALIEEGTTK